MKIRDTTSNDFEFDKCYSEHDPEQHLKDINRPKTFV